MALIDVVKCPMRDNELCLKFSSEDLRIGTQLVVYPSQVAFFVRGGEIYDQFGAGTYTLSSNNIPLLNKIINIPFGGDSPFQAEVWFINLTSKLDMKWGTPAPIQLEDPKYHIIIPVRAFGQYGLKVKDPKTFLKTLIGNMPSFYADKVDSYFKGKIISQLSEAIVRKMSDDGMSVLDVNTRLMDMSEFCNDAINKCFSRYGLTLQEFSIENISVPQDDPSLIKLKEAKALAASINATGRDIYQMDRSFDVLDSAANNKGTGGQVVGMGVGLGVSSGISSHFGNMVGNTINPNPVTPPPLPHQTTYYVYLNGQQIANQNISDLARYIKNGAMNTETLVWKAGMTQWLPAIQIPELSILFVGQTPPPLPNQNK